MSDPWVLVEPCAGSIALTLHTLGAKHAVLPYQGSKWKFRVYLTALAKRLGFKGIPTQVVLTDSGPWGVTAGVILNRREELIEALEELLPVDPKELYSQITKQLADPTYEVDFAAQHLFLQRVSFSGKAVGLRTLKDKLYWSVPGLSPSSAYGVAATDKFGAVNPMFPSLLKTLKNYKLAETFVSSEMDFANPPTEQVVRPTLVYIDPPYQGQTGYPNGTLSRQELVDLAVSWREAGATVMVSESEPIEELIACGWQSTQLRQERKTRNPFHAKKCEWVTFTGTTTK